MEYIPVFFWGDGMKLIVYSLLCMFVLPSYADVLSLDEALRITRESCSGIDESLGDLKKMAGINTAVTGAGALAAGVALGTGLAKSQVDAKIDDAEAEIQRLKAGFTNIPVYPIELDAGYIASLQNDAGTGNVVASDRYSELSELEQKSKTLGNVRTGTLAASTATSVAGAVISGQNKVDEDLESKIKKCIASVQALSSAQMAARVERSATEEDLSYVQTVIEACRDYEFVDLKPINKRASGATVSSVVGAGTGVVGTIASSVAGAKNAQFKTEKQEKNINAAANVMAGASTVAGVAATAFNAMQISAIKKVAAVAAACEGAL